MRFAGWYGIIVSLLMLCQWGFFLAAGQVPELKTEPVRIAFHLVAEFVTAISLLVSGLALLKNKPWGTSAYLVSAGMLLYTVIVSLGYFAQHGQWIFVGIFGMLLALTLASIWNASRSKTGLPHIG